MTQVEKIKRHLDDYGSISSAEAFTEYGIMRLAARISDLKKAGYEFDTEMAKGFNRYGEPTRYAVYKRVDG